jgi:hypothetical protein
MTQTTFFPIFARRTPRGATRGAALFGPPVARPVAESRKAVAHLTLSIPWPYPWRTTPCHIGHGGAAMGRENFRNCFTAGGAE